MGNDLKKTETVDNTELLSHFIKEHRLDAYKECIETHSVTYADLLSKSRADNIEAEVRPFAENIGITKKLFQDRLIKGVKALQKRPVTKVFIWEYKGWQKGWGHSSMQLSDGTYLSWWPHQRVTWSNAWCVVGGAGAASYEEDVFDLGVDAHYVSLVHLREDKVKEWWYEFKDSNGYQAVGKKAHNSATLVREALKIGGIDVGESSKLIAFTPEHLQKIMHKVGPNLLDQRRLNVPKNNERQWRIAVDGFLRNHKISNSTHWEKELNLIIFGYIIAEPFILFKKSNCKTEKFFSAGTNLTLYEAKQHALYMNNCVAFSYDSMKGIAHFHRQVSVSELEDRNESKLYVLNSHCSNLYEFHNDCFHSGDNLDGSGMAYDLEEAKEYGMRLKNCKGFTFDTWRPERKNKQAIAWFHSAIPKNRSRQLKSGTQCLYVKREEDVRSMKHHDRWLIKPIEMNI